jgi:3-phosphoshikimate 1-carboxyvinyltransferase
VAGVLEVCPVRGWGGSFEPPGDKSITHRAYLFGLLAHGETRVDRPNGGADCDATLAAAAALGAVVTRGPGHVLLAGRGIARTQPAATIDCGNSGTSLRLLAGILAANEGRGTLDGDASLRARPVGRIIAPLRRMGARLEGREGDRFPPLVVHGATLQGIDYEVPVASAQVQGCVLLAGLHAIGRTSVTLPGPARDHTARMLPAFGVVPEVEIEGPMHRVSLGGPAALRGASLRVPGDFSSAAFFLAAAAATPGARVTARGVGLNPTRTGLLDVLEAMGALVTRAEASLQAGEPIGEVSVEGPDRLRPFDVPEAWLPRMIDEVPAWTLAAAAAGGRSRLSGASELRLKESDRLAMLASQLNAIGIAVTEQPDGLEITGGPVSGGRVSAAGDHRIAMTLALFGLRAAAPVVVDDATSIGTSYPEFMDDLDVLAPGARMGEPRT